MVTVTSGSVIVGVRVLTPTVMATSVQSTMASAMSSPSSATAMLANVTGVSIAVLAVVTPPTATADVAPPPPPPPNAPLGNRAGGGEINILVIALLAVIAALLCGLVICCTAMVCWWMRRREGHVSADTRREGGISIGSVGIEMSGHFRHRSSAVDVRSHKDSVDDTVSKECVRASATMRTLSVRPMHDIVGYEEGKPTSTEAEKKAAYASRLSRAKSANWLKFGSSLGAASSGRAHEGVKPVGQV